MIPVDPQPEAPIFDLKVRKPGVKFLRKLANAQGTLKPEVTTKQWLYHNEWKYIRPYICKAYKNICAYTAHWIANTSNPNIDHFVPKSVDPWKAYEWSNYRLACPLVNTHKLDHQDVLDPFTVQKDWFFLDFPTLIMKPNSTLPRDLQEKIQTTIDRLKLNEDEAFVIDRSAWLKRYCLGGVTFAQLKRDAPFMAYELERQNLTKNINNIMRYEFEEDE